MTAPRDGVTSSASQGEQVDVLSLEPGFVRKITREIARGEIDLSRRLKDYRAQLDPFRRELRLAVRSHAAGSWSK